MKQLVMSHSQSGSREEQVLVLSPLSPCYPIQDPNLENGTAHFQCAPAPLVNLSSIISHRPAQRLSNPSQVCQEICDPKSHQADNGEIDADLLKEPFKRHLWKSPTVKRPPRLDARTNHVNKHCTKERHVGASKMVRQIKVLAINQT